MENCIFCKIINKEIKSDILYEDEDIIVFKDINPVSNGHSLLIPKKHIVTGFDEDMTNYFYKAYKISIELKKTYNWDGLTLCQNNYYGQEIKHFHIHIIPRYENDGLELKKNA